MPYQSHSHAVTAGYFGIILWDTAQVRPLVEGKFPVSIRDRYLLRIVEFEAVIPVQKVNIGQHRSS